MDSQEKTKFTVNPSKLWRDFKDACAMFFDVVRGQYPVPVKSLIWGIIFLVYFIVPFDLIPDYLIVFFGLGGADDLLALVFTLNKMYPDLEKYRTFKKNKELKKLGGK